MDNKDKLPFATQEEQQAIEARRAYQKEWRAKNKKRVQEYNKRFWLKKTAEQPKINKSAKTQKRKQVIERLSGVIEDSGKLPIVSDYEVLEAAILTYGADGQIDIAVEKMSELTKALLKERRCIKEKDCDISALKPLSKNIDEEMADVIIMLVQLQMIFKNREKVSRYINFKVKRLKKRMEGSEYDGNA